VSLDRRLWHVSATGRYQPEPGRGGYVTLSAGAAAIAERRGNTIALPAAMLENGSVQWIPLERRRVRHLGLSGASWSAIGSIERLRAAGQLLSDSYSRQVDL
jgi:hypothetical protein